MPKQIVAYLFFIIIIAFVLFWKKYFIAISNKLLIAYFLISLSSFAVGCLLGMIFGFPHEQNNTENNSFKDISNWLSKTLIGLGLVELKRIYKIFNEGIVVIASRLNFGLEYSIIFGATIIFFGIAGFMCFYFFVITDIKVTLFRFNNRIEEEKRRKIETTLSKVNLEDNAIKTSLPQLFSDRYIDEKDLDEFLDALKVVKTENLNYLEIDRIAQYLYKNGEFRLSVKYFRLSYERNKSNIYSLLNAGVILSKNLGQHEESNSLLNECLKEVDTNNEDIYNLYYNLSCNHVRMGKLEEAKSYFKKVAEGNRKLITFALEDKELQLIKSYIESLI